MLKINKWSCKLFLKWLLSLVRSVILWCMCIPTPTLYSNTTDFWQWSLNVHSSSTLLMYDLFRLIFPGLFLTTTGPGTVASLARAWVSPMGTSCMSSMPPMMSGGRPGEWRQKGTVKRWVSSPARGGEFHDKSFTNTKTKLIFDMPIYQIAHSPPTTRLTCDRPSSNCYPTALYLSWLFKGSIQWKNEFSFLLRYKRFQYTMCIISSENGSFVNINASHSCLSILYLLHTNVLKV